MNKGDLVIVFDSWDNIRSYTYIDRVNQKTYTVDGEKFNKETLRGDFMHRIEPFDKEKHPDGYKYDLIRMYKRDVECMLEDLNELIKKAQEYNHYININWDDYKTDLKDLLENLKGDFL